ncbi:uncharacterized protein LOC111089813 isoform X3 [Limulus polyphemus]|uniref:Uncharacterized protein LOC111089813 isoform X3 n=1 Tax=Limulus polyphemus TaxID=6850 RepID=A0ABM1TRY1_LIMPO|nr:uncharacterized protein LOC111089813 isoform X3 [Limulus polyphemus]
MILVECLEGFNGGLDQTFIMEVYTEETKTLYAKVSSQVPIFLVNGLTQGTVFLLLIYAVNRKGRSSVVQLSTSTVRQAEKLTRERAGTFVFNPVLTVFITMTIALITVIFILVVVVKIRKRAMLKASQQKEDRKVKSETPLQKPVEDVDDGPDIIPAKILNRKLLLCGKPSYCFISRSKDMNYFNNKVEKEKRINRILDKKSIVIDVPLIAKVLF